MTNHGPVAKGGPTVARPLSECGPVAHTLWVGHGATVAAMTFKTDL